MKIHHACSGLTTTLILPFPCFKLITLLVNYLNQLNVKDTIIILKKLILHLGMFTFLTDEWFKIPAVSPSDSHAVIQVPTLV